MRAIVNFDLQGRQPANDVNDQRLLELCTQWQMARAQQEIIWAEQDFSRMDGSLPNEGIQPSTEPLAKMCEPQETLARVGEPQTVLGARELLGIAIKMLTYRIESPESTVAQGPVVQLIRNVNEALKWLDGDTRLCPPSRSDKTDTGTKARTDRAGSFELFRSADSEQTGRFPVATAEKAVPSLTHTVRKGMCGCRGCAHECSCQAQQNSSLLHHESGRTGEAFRVSSAPMGEGRGLDGKVPQQNLLGNADNENPLKLLLQQIDGEAFRVSSAPMGEGRGLDGKVPQQNLLGNADNENPLKLLLQQIDGEAFRVSSAPMGEGGGLDGKVPQQNPELRTPHEAASAPAPRLFVKPEFNRPWSIQLRRKVDDLSFVLNLLATVTLIGLPLLAPRDNAGTHVSEQPGDLMPVRDGSSVARTSPALVVTASQKSYVNEPLPLGMWLNNDSGKETVTIAGLVEGTELSLGTSRGLAGWVLTGGDLDKTFVGPPRDFVGVMNATVELSSAGGQLLESQVTHFEWIAKTEYVLRHVVEPAKPPAVVPSHPAPVVPSLNRT